VSHLIFAVLSNLLIKLLNLGVIHTQMVSLKVRTTILLDEEI